MIKEADIDRINMSHAAKVRTKQSLRDGQRAVEAVAQALNASGDEITQEVAAGARKQQPKEKASLPMTIPDQVDKATASRLKSIIERVERLEEEKAALGHDIKEVFGEAKATGFDVKILRHIIRLRKIDLDKRREADMLIETYKSAIGME